MKNQTKTTQKLLPLLMLSLLGVSSAALAEDTETFFNVTPSAPNVMFLLSAADTMALTIDGRKATEAKPSRLTIVKGAVKTVFQNILRGPDQNLKVGIMNYGASSDVMKCTGGKKGEVCYVADSNRDYGIHGVALPITLIADPAADAVDGHEGIDNLPDPADLLVGEFIPNIVDKWEISEHAPAPIVDALYEAALYFRGEKVHWGQDIPSSEIAAHPATYVGEPIIQDRQKREIWPETAPLYKSPITHKCGSNYIILMSDGIPTYYDKTPQGNKGRVIGQAGSFFGEGADGSLSKGVGVIPPFGDQGRGGKVPKGFPAGEGGHELIRYISQNDNSPVDGDGVDTVEGENTIETFVIAFGKGFNSNELQYMQTLTSIDDYNTPVTEGYYEADNQEQLEIAFADIVRKITKRAVSFASPGYSVNVKSGLEHEREVYVPMFDRNNSSVWPGNLKKFKINDVSGKRVIQDKNNTNATDELGNITDDAIDLWSTSTTADPDGKDVEKGGLANLLKPADDRKILSDLGCAGTINCTLTALTASSVTNSLLGLDGTATAADRTALISFIRGENADGTQRFHMGDMMHSEPIVITYDAGDAVNPKKQYIFVATNEGYLHAFDTNTGEEMFAFMPEELLKNIKPQYSSLSASDHVYGIDGNLTFLGDKDSTNKYLYFGMRRGGDAYYALDVSTITEPKLLWRKGQSDSDKKYANMGQTWSIPYLARVGVNDASAICTNNKPNCKEVVIVSGGYDRNEDRDIPGTLRLDDATSTVTTGYDDGDGDLDLKGHDIFIMNAKTGAREWSLQSDESIENRAELVSSVPGGLRMLDTNYNKLVDRLYFADTSGNVWRLDLSEALGDTENPSVLTKFADLGVDGGVDARKFYNEPDVALMKLNGKSTFVVSIGTGFRAHPLDTTLDDNFYMLLDKSPFGDPDTTAIVHGALAEITFSGATVSQDGTIADKTKKGWKVNLPVNGEKSLSTALSFDGVVTFTTLIPETVSSNTDECDPPATHGRFYAFNLLSGEAGLDLNGDGTITDADIFIEVASGDIAGAPQSVFNPLSVVEKVDTDGNPTGDKACSHPVDIRIGKKLSQATGYDACRLESVYWSDPVSDK